MLRQSCGRNLQSSAQETGGLRSSFTNRTEPPARTRIKQCLESMDQKENEMTNFTSRRAIVRAATVVGAMVMGLAFSSGAMAVEKDDQRTCASIGAPYDSPG